MAGAAASEGCEVWLLLVCSTSLGMACVQHFRFHDESGSQRPEPLPENITTRVGMGNITRFFIWGQSTNWHGWEPRRGKKGAQLVSCLGPAPQQSLQQQQQHS